MGSAHSFLKLAWHGIYQVERDHFGASGVHASIYHVVAHGVVVRVWLWLQCSVALGRVQGGSVALGRVQGGSVALGRVQGGSEALGRV